MKVDGVPYSVLKPGASWRPPTLSIATPVAVPLVNSSNFDCSQVRVPCANAAGTVHEPPKFVKRKPIRKNKKSRRRLCNLVPRSVIVARTFRLSRFARAEPGARSRPSSRVIVEHYRRALMPSRRFKPKTDARAELLSLLARKSFRLGEFKLSSGGTSDYYIDCRTTTLDAQGSRLTGEVFLAEILRHDWKPAAIGGLTMGADPIVTAVSVVSGELHGFLVRKSEKQHGTGQRLEGFREKGARVVIVDDVCTTGASTIQAIEAARDFGFVIAGAMCLVEREEAGGRPNVEKAAVPAPFVSIFTANEVRREHIRQNAKQMTPHAR